jgi:hypothetical protein
MNVDELRTGLVTLAAEVDTGPAGDLTDAHTRLSGVDRLVERARRTRRAAAAAAVVAVVAAAGLLASELPHDSSSTPTSGLPTVTENGISLYTAPAGGRLIGHVVSVPGARSATVTITPPSLDLAWAVECSDAASAGATGKTSPHFSLSVRGRPVSSGGCRGSDDATPMNFDSYFGFGSPAGNAAGWRDLGLRVGEPVTFTIRLTGPHAAGARSQLAFGLWERGPQQNGSGVWYPRQRVIDGTTYEAESLTTDRFASRRAAISVPLGTDYDRYWVTGGAEGLDGNGVLQVGGGAMAALDAGGGAELGAGYRAPHAPVPVTFKSHHGAVVSGVLYAIVYHPVDGP